MSRRRRTHSTWLKPTRRQFLQVSAAAAAAAMIPWRRASAFYNTTPRTIPLFGTPFRGVGPGGIPVCAPDAFPAPVTGALHYTMNVNQYKDPGVCPTLGDTTLWGYNPKNPLGGGVQPQRHLGGIIVAQKGQAIQVTFKNNLKGLPGHIIPLDTSIPGANQSPFRIATHLHGALVPWISDGGPFDWWDPDGNHGASFLNNRVLNPKAKKNEGEYYYPNDQSSRFLIMHDHAMGTTRINAYAGIGTAYLIRDNFEINLKNKGLPEFIENSVLGGTPVRELPLVIQDKVFVGNNIDSDDPTWPSVCPSSPGSLWYDHTYNPADVGVPTFPGTASILQDPSALPEFFGDTMLCNGTAFPTTPVDAGRYRLRILDICNARFLNLQLYVADNSPDGITLDRDGRPKNLPFIDGDSGKPSLMQIGTDGGLLPHAARVPTNVPYFESATTLKSLLMGPGERADVILNFKNHYGQKIILYNDAPGPFPAAAGDPATDYFPGLANGNPVNLLSTPGYGPNTRILMRFEVGPQIANDPPLRIRAIGDPGGATSLLNGNDPLLVPLGVTALPPRKAVRRRTLTLNEGFDEHGRLIQMLGTNSPNAAASDTFYGQPYEDAPTEVVQRGDTEVWEIYNLTGDVHPMHIHLVNWQIISRQPFATDGKGNPIFGSFNGYPAVPPDPNEAGWKDTVRMYPGTVTRVIAKFDLARIKREDNCRDDWDYGWDNDRGHDRGRPDWEDCDRPDGGRDPKIVHTPHSPRMGGHEFVWHCHILEHEEHDMMRPLKVV